MLKKSFLTFAVLFSATLFFGLNKDFGARRRYGGDPDSGIVPQAKDSLCRISVYDAIFRDIDSLEGWDWRLMSAMAYEESRFSPDIKSERGAVGLMQIMPGVARRYGIAGDRIADPDTNIRLAARILRRIDVSLRFAPGIAPDERIRIVLACYNGGIGHVSDARRLASFRGENPDSWETTARYLELMAQPEYYRHEAVRCGRFGGGRETRTYVDNVMRRYDRYRRIAGR